jgi:hypothetical protein
MQPGFSNGDISLVASNYIDSALQVSAGNSLNPRDTAGRRISRDPPQPPRAQNAQTLVAAPTTLKTGTLLDFAPPECSRGHTSGRPRSFGNIKYFEVAASTGVRLLERKFTMLWGQSLS